MMLIRLLRNRAFCFTMKVCSKCGIEKDESEFGACKSKKGQVFYRNTCKSCHRQQAKDWVKNNLEHRQEQQANYKKEHYAQNKDSHLQRGRQYHKKIVEKSTNTYLRILLIKQGIPETAIEQYPILFELKKAQLLNKREIKKQGYDNENK